MPDSNAFRQELTDLLNTHNLESGSGTPDFILATYLANCLHAYDKALQAREKWYSTIPQPTKENPTTGNLAQAEGIPASFKTGLQDIEEGRTVDMEKALHEKPPL